MAIVSPSAEALDNSGETNYRQHWRENRLIQKK
jgi:hypothetical protein